MSLVPDRFAQSLADSELIISQQRITRRQFLGTTAITASGILMLGMRRLDANQTVTPSDFSSTGHFWYRLQPAGPYIDSQCDNKAFGFIGETISLSEDNALPQGNKPKLAKRRLLELCWTCLFDYQQTLWMRI